MKRHEVVIVGAGHHGLTVGSYLARAGLDVCVVEAQPQVGGGCFSGEAAAPGFVSDKCSVVHHLFQSSPIILRDELGLISRYGLEYVRPDVSTCVHFTDGTWLSICKDLDDTCASIGKLSARDAEAYRHFNTWVSSAMDMLIAGFYAPPVPFGVQAAMLDSSPEGRDLLRCMMLSAMDVVEEWFEHEKVQIAITRWVSEIMLAPQTKGTGLVVPMMIGLQHRNPPGLPVGGSGVVSQLMRKLIEDCAGTVLTGRAVSDLLVKGGDCAGVRLEDGEEIEATRAVVSNLNIKLMFPGMVPARAVPGDFQDGVDRLRPVSYSAFSQAYALHEPLRFKVDSDEVQNAMLVELALPSRSEYLRYFDDLNHGIPAHSPAVVCQTRHDPTRAPDGKHTLYVYEYAPYEYHGNDPTGWDEAKHSYALSLREFIGRHTTNLHDDNIIGVASQTPIDMERTNPSYLRGDFGHLAAYLDQSMGNRPLPGWNFKTPVEKLYLCGPGCHPGSGITGAGRAAAQVVLEDLGLDIDRLA